MATPQPPDPAAGRPAPARGYELFDTAFGWSGIAWNHAGIVRLRLPEADAAVLEAKLRRLCGTRMTPPPPVAAAIVLLQRYLEGEPVGFDAVAVDLEAAPPVHRRVYEITRRIGFGATATYGEIATAAGPPVIARVVGTAMAKNPVPLIVPCHRVLAAGGKPGGFSAPGGVATKARLLALEGVRLEPGQPWLPGFE